MDYSFPRSLAVSPRITVGASKNTPIGDIEGGDSSKATELGRSKDFSLPQYRKNLITVHEGSMLRKALTGTCSVQPIAG